MFCFFVEAVVERHDALAVQLRLSREWERLDLQQLGDIGPFTTQDPGIIALGAVFGLEQVFQESLMGKTPARGLAQ
jgi:hypothetical protein